MAPLLNSWIKSSKGKGILKKITYRSLLSYKLLKGWWRKNSIMDKIYEKKLIKEKSSMRSYGYPIKARSSRREITKFATIGIIKFIFSDFLINQRI